MIFNVRSGSSIGIAGFARDTAKAAVEKALELIRLFVILRLCVDP